VTGTDTGVGKTWVTAALARAARDDGEPREIVKLVQTGLGPDERGDAESAGERAGCAWREFYRFRLAADPWSAAFDEGAPPLGAAALGSQLIALPHAAIVEGSGGAAVPLNADESISDAARFGGCEAIVVIGLRLGCINHALLTLDYLGRRGVGIRGAVFCEAWERTEPAYRSQVERALARHVRIAGTIVFDPDPEASLVTGARIVASLLSPAYGADERTPAVPR
jgi:dethiobiotin synthetase